MNILLRGAAASVVVIGTFAFAGAVLAAGHTPHAVPTAPGQNKIQCFDGTTDGGFGGTCTLQNNGAKSPATLNNTDSNAAGDYAGVYYQNSNNDWKLLSNVTLLGYDYTGTTTPMPGDLSLNVPIDTNGDLVTDGYAFIDAYYCLGVNGHVDAVNDPNCGIWFLGTEYTNWAALAAAYPAAKVNGIAFVIAERTPAEGPALWTISNFQNGKVGK